MYLAAWQAVLPAACYYNTSWWSMACLWVSVCVCVGRMEESCKNFWANWHAAWGSDLPNEPCIGLYMGDT